MQALILTMICCVTLATFGAVVLKLPVLIKFTPELLTLFAIAQVLFNGTRQRFRLIAGKYWLVFGAIALVIICGVASNDVGSGPLLAGMRYYLRAIPFFFIPAVFAFTDEQIVKQLKYVVAVALLQVPVAAYQRWTVWSQNRFTGDPVFGTLINSGILSIFLICIVLVLIGLFLKKRISKPAFAALFFILLIPTTINETKVTVILLPLTLLLVLVVGAPRGRRLRIVGMAVSLLVTFGAIFIPVYDLMQTHNPYKKDLVTFFTDEKQIGQYMEAKTAGVGTTAQVGRGDAIRIPLEYLSKDPIHLMFGLGIGNASHSEIGENFTGNYYGIFKSFLITSFTVFILEIGLLGTGLVFLLYWLLFRDTMILSKTDDSLTASIAVGWVGVVAAMAVATAYSPIHTFESLSYLFWYFSGLVVARRVQIGLGTSA